METEGKGRLRALLNPFSAINMLCLFVSDTSSWGSVFHDIVKHPSTPPHPCQEGRRIGRQYLPDFFPVREKTMWLSSNFSAAFKNSFLFFSCPPKPCSNPDNQLYEWSKKLRHFGHFWLLSVSCLPLFPFFGILCVSAPLQFHFLSLSSLPLLSSCLKYVFLSF